MSEKMDGVRAYWNGETLLSRNSKRILCPSWFTKEFPQGIELDGELWMGRGRFEKTVATLLKSEEDKSWKWIRFMVFDLVSKEPFEDRMAILRGLNLPSQVSLLEQKICLGNQHLMKELTEIVEGGGEGIIVTEPKSFYIAGRTKSRLKVKVLLSP